MSHVNNFKMLFGDSLPSGMRGYIVDLSDEDVHNPFLILSRYSGKDGGQMAIKNRVLYVQAPSFDHPKAKQLAV